MVRCNDVAQILEYARPVKGYLRSCSTNVRFKANESLLDSNGVPKTRTPTMDSTTRATIFINEAGLYRLVFRSKTPKTE